jgi:hypothetical protein
MRPFSTRFSTAHSCFGCLSAEPDSDSMTLQGSGGTGGFRSPTVPPVLLTIEGTGGLAGADFTSLEDDFELSLSDIPCALQSSFCGVSG